MTHAQQREAMRLWLRLEDARNIVAEARSSIFLLADDVDPVTLKICNLQDLVLAVIKSDELPKLEPL